MEGFLSLWIPCSLSLPAAHIRKPLFPLSMSTSLPKLTFFTSHNRKFAISTGFVIGTEAFLSSCTLPSGSQVIKERSHLRFQTRSASASSQPLAEEVRGNDVKDNPVSRDAIRHEFLTFHASRGHKVLPRSSLAPDDPTVLLTIAGMLQFKPIFLGKIPRQVPCATTVQRCIRINDVENVGRTARHHTFFEMLGNFTFIDYFKKESIK